MAFTPVPIDSKNKINNAGKVLISNESDNASFLRALKLAEKWRACHAYPLNTFNTYLRNNIKKIHGNPIVAQRLKRMPTIIDKLSRYPSMKLTTMQDIAGIRAIVDRIEDVFSLVNIFHVAKFPHSLTNEKNYIISPRDEDGYRSYHLIYKYKSNFAPAYNDLLIELQIRTKLEHIWATAVETMDTITGQALKYRKGQQDWQDFFAITSSAFAYIEETPLIPRFSHLSKIQTFKEVSLIEKKIGALEQMRGLSLAANAISHDQFGSGWYYHLIILNSLEKTVKIQPYPKDKIEEASRDYSTYEERAANGEPIEPVLVAGLKLKSLQKAYPNFFLDVKDFIKQIENIEKQSV